MTEKTKEFWHVAVFDDPEKLATFLNHVNLRPDQIVSVQFHPLTNTVQRILLTCRLTESQVRAREEWEAVERILNPGTVALASGGH